MSTTTRRSDLSRYGRLGALTKSAMGLSDTTAATAAWQRNLLAKIDPDGSLSDDERRRRYEAAVRVKMTRAAMARWGDRKAA